MMATYRQLHYKSYVRTNIAPDTHTLYSCDELEVLQMSYTLLNIHKHSLVPDLAVPVVLYAQNNFVLLLHFTDNFTILSNQMILHSVKLVNDIF